ncbi:PPOX class F420-dependent oxidoreductase [Kitasatospora sp. NBC_01560]|uniref:PPOX class F420-dependent oxidoreductase n=1 Tax=Kitasatospora sp. NBC_01560 TaxID=2975965 RepID=UPI00386AA643
MHRPTAPEWPHPLELPAAVDENGATRPVGSPTRTRVPPALGRYDEGSRTTGPDTAEHRRGTGRRRGRSPHRTDLAPPLLDPAPTDPEREDIVHHRTDELADSRYLLLTTFTASGGRVASPSWVVADGAALGIWTPVHSGEAERVRRHPRVLVGPCDAHGRPTGRQLPARAAVCDEDATARYRISLINKYGMTALIVLARSRLRLGLAGTVGIRITLTGPEQRLIGPEWPPPTAYCPN